MSKVPLSALWFSRILWRTLLELKKPIKLGYTLSKYYNNKLLPEIKLIEVEHDKLITELGDPKPDNPEEKQLSMTSPKFPEFNRRIGELLKHEIEIEQLEMTLDDLIEAVPADSALGGDILTLAPFFREAKQAAA